MQSIVPRASACVHPAPIWGHLSDAGCGVFLHCTACASDLCPTCGGKVFRRAVDSKFKRAHVVHYCTDTASKDSAACAYTGETPEHAHAKILLRDRIRDSIPIDSSINTFTINVSTCLEDVHTVSFKVELKAEYSCTVETVLNQNGSRRVGDVVIKDAKEVTVYIFEIFKTSRTKNSRPEPWFELAAGDVLKALAVPDGWTSRALDCVRFQNNNTNCSRPPCATCATLEVERREREAEAFAARALQRQTRVDEDREEKRKQRAALVDEHGHCKDKLGTCFSQCCAPTCDRPNICDVNSSNVCPATGCGGCALLPCARCGGGTPRWLHEIFSSLCSRSCEWDAGESAEHTLAALTLRDKIRALVPLLGTAPATSRFGVCVLLCSFHNEQYNHKRFDNFVLRPGFTCDVESDTGAGKSRRVGAVVLKNAEGTLVCAFAISSDSPGATRARPEPWFECDASDSLEALSNKDWAKGKLRCVRFETNAPRCRRGRCTQCAKYWSDRNEKKAKDEKERARLAAEIATARQAKLEAEMQEHRKCVLERDLVLAARQCERERNARRVAQLQRKYYFIWKKRHKKAKSRYNGVRRYFLRWVLKARVRSKRFISVIKEMVRIREKEESDHAVRKKFEYTWNEHKRKLDAITPHTKPVQKLSIKEMFASLKHSI